MHNRTMIEINFLNLVSDTPSNTSTMKQYTKEDQNNIRNPIGINKRHTLGYDFRLDYEFNDYDTDFAINQSDKNNNSKKHHDINNLKNKSITQYPKDLSSFCDWIISKDEFKPYLIYNWTNKDSYFAKFLLILKILKLKKIKRRINNNNINNSSSTTDLLTKTKRKNNKSKIKSSTNIRKLNRINEQNYIKKLNKNSIEFKLLSMDYSNLRRINKIELSKHIIPSLTHIKKYSLEENKNGLWMLIHGLVFDISELLDNHPGGVECLLDCVGVDATRVFDDVGHSDIAWEMMENSIVGVMDYMISTDEEDEEEEDDELLILTETEINNINNTIRYKLVWNDIGLEYLFFITTSVFGLICFVYLQRKKWDEWGNWSE